MTSPGLPSTPVVPRWVAACVLTAALTTTAPVAAQGVIFQWVDSRGNLHLSDELADVPEPYRAMYEARLREAAEARKHAAAAPGVRPPAPAVASGPTPSEPSVIDAEAARRQRWKEQVATWRAALAAATSDLARADASVGELESNVVLAQTPLVAVELEKAREARAAALLRVENARRMLLNELPARARREGVPPAWLM